MNGFIEKNKTKIPTSTYRVKKKNMLDFQVTNRHPVVTYDNSYRQILAVVQMEWSAFDGSLSLPQFQMKLTPHNVKKRKKKKQNW